MEEVTQEQIDNALFHYTTADGLIGIIGKNELWSTAYYCMNDLSELKFGIGFINEVLSEYKRKGVDGSILEKCRKMNVDFDEVSQIFEDFIFKSIFEKSCAFITSFCRSNKKSFQDGLLSQWRGYGTDGGYAIQFNRRRIYTRIKGVQVSTGGGYELRDVSYDTENELLNDLKLYKSEFIESFLYIVESEYSRRMNNSTEKFLNPVEKMNDDNDDVIYKYLLYLVHTKSKYFEEEMETRMSLLDPVDVENKDYELKTFYFNRGGMIVPYKKTPAIINISSCIDAIIVGPAPRMDDRVKAVKHLLRTNGLIGAKDHEDVKVRASKIPFVRV